MHLIHMIHSSKIFKSSLRKNSWLFLALLAIFVIGSFLSVYPTRLLGNIINLLAEPTAGEAVKQFIFLYILIRVVSLSITIIGKYLQEYISNKLECELRIESIQATFNMDMYKLENIQSTQFTSRIFDAINQLILTVLNMITWLGKTLTTLLFTLYFLFKIDFMITLAFIPLVPCMAVLTRMISARKKMIAKSEAENAGHVRDFIQEIMSSFKEVKNYNCTRWIFEKYSSLEMKWMESKIKSNFLSSAVFWLLSLFGIVVVSIILIASISKSLTHQLNPGDITAMILYSGTVFNGVMEVFNQIIIFKSLEVSIERFNEVMQDTQENIGNGGRQTAMPENYDLSVSHVDFCYSHSEKVLDNITFEIPFGSSAAIIGRSGSGKSTLLKLLLGMYRPSGGTVQIGGANVSGLGNECRAECITCAFQETFLYNMSLYDNVVLGKTISEEALTNALQLSDMTAFVREQPEGIHTPLYERGSNLSGGQKQRIGLARCLLKPSKIILLDEVSSALDNVTEKYIIENLKNLKGHTRIVVSHKPEMMLWTDYAIVMESGRIVDIGTHKELLARCKTYAEIINS